MITITPINRPTKRPLSVGNVPAEGGTIFLAASEPAMASIGTIIRKRPMNIARPSVEFQNGVLADRPAKGLPFLPGGETYAYSASENPCGPALASALVPGSITTATAVKPSMHIGRIR